MTQPQPPDPLQVFGQYLRHFAQQKKQILSSQQQTANSSPSTTTTTQLQQQQQQQQHNNHNNNSIITSTQQQLQDLQTELLQALDTLFPSSNNNDCSSSLVQGAMEILDHTDERDGAGAITKVTTTMGRSMYLVASSNASSFGTAAAGGLASPPPGRMTMNSDHVNDHHNSMNHNPTLSHYFCIIPDYHASLWTDQQQQGCNDNDMDDDSDSDDDDDDEFYFCSCPSFYDHGILAENPNPIATRPPSRRLCQHLLALTLAPALDVKPLTLELTKPPQEPPGNSNNNNNNNNNSGNDFAQLLISRIGL